MHKGDAMKGKKTAKITVFSILGLVLAILIFLGIRYKDTVRLVFNWDNIVSFVNSQRYSGEEIEGKMQENKKQMEEIAKEDPNINIRGDLTEEEAKALKDGIITQEEAVAIVKGDTTLKEILSKKEEKKEDEKTAKKEDGNPSKETSAKPQADPPKKDRASEIIAELYVLQADFITRLESVGDRAYEDYKAQHYDRTKVMDIVDSYMGEVASLERECDTRVSELLKELEAELTATGGDLSNVKKIRKYYYDEKRLKKTYYLNKLNDEDYK